VRDLKLPKITSSTLHFFKLAPLAPHDNHEQNKNPQPVVNVMNDRSATTRNDTMVRATSIQPATLIRTYAVGLHRDQRTWFPRKQAGHLTAGCQPVQNVDKKTLANQGRPNMTPRTP
jgi:hypothetical protein